MSDSPLLARLSALLVFLIYYPWIPLVLAAFGAWIVWYLSQVNRRD